MTYPLFERLRGSSVAATAARVTANGSASAAIRDVERALVEALGSEGLRGLPQLSTRGGPPFYGLRIFGRARRKDPLSFSREELVIGRDGRLAMARLAEVASLDIDGECYFEARSRGVEDGELWADVLEPYAEAVVEVIEEHLKRTEQRTREYERTTRLAAGIRSLLSG